MEDLKILKRKEYANPFEFESAVKDYFALCDDGDSKKAATKRISKHGLLVYLGLYKNAEFKKYTEKGGMWEMVGDYATARIAQHYEEQLTIMRNPTGSIFGLKNMLPDEYKDVHTNENVKVNIGADEAYKDRLNNLKAKKEVDKLTRPVPLQKKGLWGKENKPNGIDEPEDDTDEPE
jgi:hypothetical protein